MRRRQVETIGAIGMLLAVALVTSGGISAADLKVGAYYLFQVDTALGTHFVKVTILDRYGSEVMVRETFYNDTSRIERTAVYKSSEAWFMERSIKDPNLGKAKLLRTGIDTDVSLSTWGTYGPPYDWSWYDTELYGYWAHDKWATVSVDHQKGTMAGASAAYAGPGFGGGASPGVGDDRRGDRRGRNGHI